MNGADSEAGSWHVVDDDAEWMLETRPPRPLDLTEACFMDVSKTGDDSRGLGRTPEDKFDGGKRRS